MFEKLLGRQPTIKEEAKQGVLVTNRMGYAPNTKIAYKPTLVPTLQKEHQLLMSMFWKAVDAAESRKTDLTKELLNMFKDMFVDHVLKENTSLYIYLRHSAKKESSQEAVRALKRDMDVIGRKVKDFIDYANMETTEVDAQFISEMRSVGGLLQRRIEQEETFVYPTYQPAD